MSTVSVPATQPESRSRTRSSWLYATPMWASFAIIAMWLAVLFIGLFGGDIVSNNGTPGAGTYTTIPSVVAVVPFAFVATLVVARWGFGSRKRGREDDGAS
jgi:hypothetical protein